MSRLCARPGCSEPAAAAMTYDYAARTVWIDDLAADTDPMSYELCVPHADSLSVPLGWARTDRRADRRPLFHTAIAV